MCVGQDMSAVDEAFGSKYPESYDVPKNPVPFNSKFLVSGAHCVVIAQSCYMYSM